MTTSCPLPMATCLNFRITSVDHAFGPSYYGYYFNFWNSEIDALLGRTNWSGETFYVINSRTKYRGRVVIWRGANGGSIGDGHGRFDGDPNPYGYLWSPGDTMNMPIASTCIGANRTLPNCVCADGFYEAGGNDCVTVTVPKVCAMPARIESKWDSIRFWLGGTEKILT